MIWSPSFELPTLKPAPSAQYMLGCGSCRACSFSDHITARHPFASKLTSVCTRSDGENSRLPTHTAPHLEGRGAPNIPGRHARALSAPCTSHQHTRPEGGGTRTANPAPHRDPAPPKQDRRTGCPRQQPYSQSGHVPASRGTNSSPRAKRDKRLLPNTLPERPQTRSS